MKSEKITTPKNPNLLAESYKDPEESRRHSIREARNAVPNPFFQSVSTFNCLSR